LTGFQSVDPAPVIVRRQDQAARGRRRYPPHLAQSTACGPLRYLDASPEGDGRLYGALAFSEDGDVTVELLDDEGRVVDGAA
jgi:hypothetical protein